MEIRVQIDDELIEELRETLGKKKATEIMKDALTLLKWAADEKERKRHILSSNEKGEDVHRLVMPGLEIS